MSRYFLGRRYGNVPLTVSGSGSNARAPIVAFGDYCGRYGLVRRYGNVAQQTSGSGNGDTRAPLIAAPRGLCNPDGSLIDGEIYLARLFGNIHNVPVVVPVCNHCATSGGSGASGSGYGSGSGSGSGGGGGGANPGGDGNDDGTFCCRCRRFINDGSDYFPATLDFTITSSYLGTRSLSLTKASFGYSCTSTDVVLPFPGRIKALYTGSYSDGAGGLTNLIDCNDGSSRLAANEEILNVNIFCADCNLGASPPSSWSCYYTWARRVGGIPSAVSGTRVLTVNTCAPKWSATATQTAICSDPAKGYLALCCDNGFFYNDYVPPSGGPFPPSTPFRYGHCFPALVLDAPAVGSTIQLDADEP